MQVFPAPSDIIILHRLDQTIVRQLIPGRTASLFGTHQVSVYQSLYGFFIQSLLGAAKNLPANSSLGNQRIATPIADEPLTDVGSVGNDGHLLGVVGGQGAVHATRRFNII